jgi:hypothetical protein
MDMGASASENRRDTMDEQQILKKLDRIKDIPTLPTIVFELNKHLRDPDTSIKIVCDTIEKDQAIALKILKLVNSAFYGFRSKISDLRNAVVLLGYNAVRNAIVSLSVINAFPKRVALMDFDISQFWKHSLAVAVTSKNIAQLSKKESPDNCFGKKSCPLIIPKSAPIWLQNGNCPRGWWMRFAGITIFSPKARIPTLSRTFIWPISSSTVTTLIRNFGWICQKCIRKS